VLRYVLVIGFLLVVSAVIVLVLWEIRMIAIPAMIGLWIGGLRAVFGDGSALTQEQRRRIQVMGYYEDHPWE
jgi:hypothetical protein